MPVLCRTRKLDGHVLTRLSPAPATRRLPIAGALLGIVLLWGCASDQSTPTGGVWRDSAGISILEMQGHILQTEWRAVDSIPLIQVGVVDGEEPYLFQFLFHGLRATDGSLAVLDGATQQIRFFDQNGRFMFAAAGRGGGPGQLEVSGSMLPGPDTSILVRDRVRLNRYAWSGEFLGSTPIEWGRMQQLTLPAYRAMDPAIPLSTGDWLIAGLPTEQEEPATGVREQENAFFHISASYDRVETLGIFPGARSVEVDGGQVWVPFVASPIIGAGGEPSRVYLSANTSYEVLQFNVAGELMQRIRVDQAPEPVSGADLEDWKERQRRTYERRGDPARAERIIAETPVPAQLPVYSEFRVDRLGRLWAELHGHIGQPQQFLVFDTTGVPLGKVILPDRLRIMDIGRDYIMGVWYDDLGVEFVRVYRYVDTG